MAHNSQKMFKCPMCTFESNVDDAKQFEQHYKHEHPNVAYKWQKVCDKVSIILFKHNKIICTFFISLNIIPYVKLLYSP